MKQIALKLPTTLLALSLGGTVACSQKDPAQCKAALDGIRTALEKDDVAAAKEGRTLGYKHCKPNVMGSVDRDIVTKQSELATHEAESAAKAQETKMLLDLLVQQIAANSGPADGKGEGEDEDEGKVKPAAPCPTGADESLCTSKRKIQGKPYEIEFAFFKEDPTAFRYRTEPSGGFDCAALGTHTVKREWKQGKRERKHCGFTGGTLDGLEAITSVGPGEYWVEVFSAKFVEGTPALKERLEKEGI